jgi:NADH:ubiquinone oxidoreductase subunit 4 (subunit M)
MTLREFSIAAPLLALAIFFGVYPQALLNYMQPSVNKTVSDLTKWKELADKNAPQEQPPRTAEIAHPQPKS